MLVLENCRTGFHTTISRAQIAAYRLVKPAPAACPDTPEPQPEAVQSD